MTGFRVSATVWPARNDGFFFPRRMGELALGCRNMRITDHERQAIVEIVRRFYGDDVEIRLFGSRANDAARGGDIDLHVTVAPTIAEDAKRELDLAVELEKALGERRIDIVVSARGLAPRPIDRVAHETGIVLEP